MFMSSVKRLQMLRHDIIRHGCGDRINPPGGLMINHYNRMTCRPPREVGMDLGLGGLRSGWLIRRF